MGVAFSRLDCLSISIAKRKRWCRDSDIPDKSQASVGINRAVRAYLEKENEERIFVMMRSKDYGLDCLALTASHDIQTGSIHFESRHRLYSSLRHRFIEDDLLFA